MNYRLHLEYDGTRFHGWQLQPGDLSIQGVLEKALEQVLGEAVRLKAAGRTDSGVHALGQVANFHTSCSPDPQRLQKSLNALVTPLIGVRRVDIVSDSFDARRDAHSRVYQYRIWNEPWVSPFMARYSWHWRTPLDVGAMKEAIGCLVGEKDFSAFRGTGSEALHSVRRVFFNSVERKESLIFYTVEATAFLRHMVRNIMGTLVLVGAGQLSAGGFHSILKMGDRAKAGATAPARGLFLMNVNY